MGAAKKEIRAKQASHRLRRRRRKIAAAAGAMLLVPGIVSGEPISASRTGDFSALADAGRGLMGLVDPGSVGADGKLSENDRIGADLLRDAGNPNLLGQEGLDLPSGPLGIPGIMLQAYQRAADTLATSHPNGHLHWSLLAAIGRIESNHGRGGQVFGNGDTVRPILGPVLNGGGFAAISDTDGGTFDGDGRWDRAVGAMQFIPSTWKGYASDGNGDRVSSPHNVFDATLAAGKYLLSGGMDLANPQQRALAVFRYNHSDSYVRTVLIWADAYAKGVVPLPSTPVPTVPPLQQGSGQPVGADNGQQQNNNQPPPNNNNPGNSTPPTSPTPKPPDPPQCPPPSNPPTSTTTPTTTTTVPPNCPTPPTSSTTTTTTPKPEPPTSTTTSGTSGGGSEPPTTTTTTTTAAQETSTAAEPTSTTGP